MLRVLGKRELEKTELIIAGSLSVAGFQLLNIMLVDATSSLLFCATKKDI